MKKYRFKATIQAGIGGGAAVIFPYNVEEEFGAKARVPVSAMLEGVPYRGSLVKCGATSHMLGVLKGIREQIGKRFGDIEILKSRDIADAIGYIVTRPWHMSINEILIRPTEQEG